MSASGLYLDHNAASPPRPEAVAAALAWLGPAAANPSSLHGPGQRARAALEAARAQVAAGLGGRPADWRFTSGATEACNLFLRGLRAAAPDRPLLVGATEHPAVLETARALGAAGGPVEVLPVGPDGRVDPGTLAAALRARPGAVVALMAANHETGVLHDLAGAAAAVHAAGGLLFSDISQAAGKLALDVAALGLDAAAGSGSKFGGPPGSGLLYVRPGLALASVQTGGPQEGGLRAGTENLPAAAGLAAALGAALAEREAQAARWAEATELLAAACARLLRGSRRPGEGAPRVPNTLCVTLEGGDRDLLLAALDRRGVQASAGAACAAGAALPSEVLLAMGVPERHARREVRFSFGPGQGPAEALRAAEALEAVCARLP